jgi:hypothetical protein
MGLSGVDVMRTGVGLYEKGEGAPRPGGDGPGIDLHEGYGGSQAGRCGASACLQDIVIHDGIHAFIRQVGQHFFHGPVAG